MKNTIINIKTFSNSSEVDVTVYKDSNYNVDEYIQAHLGEITSVEEVELVVLDINDVFPNVANKIEKLEDEYLENGGSDYIVEYNPNY